MVAGRLPVLQTASLTQHKMECTEEGQACAHSGDPFMLLRLQPSAKTYTLPGSRKALFETHKLSDHLRGNYMYTQQNIHRSVTGCGRQHPVTDPYTLCYRPGKVHVAYRLYIQICAALIQ